MKSIKVYLSIVTGLLIVAIGLGVYVWYTVQELNTNISKAREESKDIPISTLEVSTSENQSE